MKGKHIVSSLLSLTIAFSMPFGMTACSSGSASSAVPASSQETSKTSSSDTNVSAKIDLWTHYGSDNKAEVDWAVKKVKEKYPNIQFQIEDMPQDGNQAIKARAATGSLPDIMYLSSGLINVLTKSNSVIQLDQYIQKSNFKDELNTATQKYGLTSPDGHNYVFTAQGVAPILWYYNKKIFADNNIKVPANYNELLSTVKALNAKGITPMALWGKEPWPLGAFFDAFAMRQNPAGVLALSTGKAAASQYTDSVNKIKTLIDAGMFEKGMTNVDYDTAFSMFTSGKAAMFQNGSWSVKDIMKAMGDKGSDIDFFASYPTGDAGVTTNNMCFGGGGDTTGYGISANAKNKDLCAEIARLLAIYQPQYEYIYQGATDVSVKLTNLTSNQKIPAMAQKLVSAIPQMTLESSLLHNLSNTEFATGFFEEMQKFMVGESASNFTQNVDKLSKQSN